MCACVNDLKWKLVSKPFEQVQELSFQPYCYVKSGCFMNQRWDRRPCWRPKTLGRAWFYQSLGHPRSRNCLFGNSHLTPTTLRTTKQYASIVISQAVLILWGRSRFIISIWRALISPPLHAADSFCVYGPWGGSLDVRARSASFLLPLKSWLPPRGALTHRGHDFLFEAVACSTHPSLFQMPRDGKPTTCMALFRTLDSHCASLR